MMKVITFGTKGNESLMVLVNIGNITFSQWHKIELCKDQSIQCAVGSAFF